jgi:hypothetical protein
MEDARFIGNEAALSDGGALALTDSPNHEVHETSFVDNEALNEGGAIDLRTGGAVTIDNSTFTRNESLRGSAAFFDTTAASSQLRDSTIAGNSANSDGGGAVTPEAVADLGLERSIISANTDLNGPSNCGAAVAGNFAGSYNLVAVNDCGLNAGVSGNILGVDPQLAPAGVYPGGSSTVLPPFAGSPAVNAVPNAFCEATVDQYNRPRPDTVGGMCDIGAYEGSVPRPVVTQPNTTTSPPPETAKKKCKKGRKLKKGKCKKKKRKKKK